MKTIIHMRYNDYDYIMYNYECGSIAVLFVRTKSRNLSMETQYHKS
jgi:hypothetical protein